MNFLKSFSEFILEARRAQHFNERSEERIGNLANISLPANVTRSIKLLGHDMSAVRKQIMQLVKDIFYEQASRVEAKDFVGTRGIPACTFTIKVGATSGPIKLTMKSYVYKKNKENGDYILDDAGNKIVIGEKTHIGEKVYICIADNTMTTITVYPLETTEKQITADMEKHFSKKGKPSRVIVSPFTEASEFELKLTEDGVVSRTDLFVGQSISTIPQREQQWTVREGEIIKLDIPFAGGFVELPIVEVINPQVKSNPKGEPSVLWKDDEIVKVAVGIQKDGRQLKLIKALSPDTIIYLPIGENQKLIKCVITGKIIDTRRPTPVNLKFKALE
jgi:hypothetical protein